jgi:DNA polymerase-3 subunit delta'
MIYPWQRESWTRLERARSADRFPHALLIEGPPGAGKREFALKLARTLLCARTEVIFEACGACRSCQLLEAGTHPDLLLLTPESEGKDLKIDQIRAVVEFVSLRSHYDRGKVVLIPRAELMNRSAANALLKTLEEPPSQSVLILVSSRPGLLPATIRSRCQRLHIRAGDDEASVAWLEARVPAGVAAGALLGLSGGGPLAALEACRQSTLELRRAIVNGLAQIARRPGSAVRVADEWSGHGVAEAFERLRGLLRDLLVYRVTGTPALMLNGDLAEDLQQLAKGLDLTGLFEAHDKLLEFERLLGASSGIREQELLLDFSLYWANGVCSEGNREQ